MPGDAKMPGGGADIPAQLAYPVHSSQGVIGELRGLLGTCRHGILTVRSQVPVRFSTKRREFS